MISLDRLKSLSNLEVFNEIDFQFADFISSKATKAQSELYLACLLLSYYSNQQHSLLPLNFVQGKKLSALIKKEVEEDFVVDFSKITSWEETFSEVVGDAEDLKPIVYDHHALYLNKYFHAEKKVVEMILDSQDQFEISKTLEDKLNKLFLPKPGYSTPKPNWQKVAAFMALRSKFCVISGGPGTGKTTTVGKILALLLEQNPSLKIDLVAPTGKAADRLGESIRQVKHGLSEQVSREIVDKIPEDASTIHRYLNYHGGEQTFLYSESKKTQSDLLLIDECSMVALPLFRHLLLALKNECRVILLGDKDQLTAVETGNVLGELTHTDQINLFSKRFCHDYRVMTNESFDNEVSDETILVDRILRLEHSYRFRDDQGVGKLAKLINECRADHQLSDFKILFEQYDDISLQKIPVTWSVKHALNDGFFDHYLSYLKDFRVGGEGTLLSFINEFRILCASRSGRYGVEQINKMISREVFRSDDVGLYHGRCIMIRQNNRHLDLYNGDVGIVLHKEGLPYVYFAAEEGGVREFSPTILPDYETAFAMTVHKSQGSEYKNICVILPEYNKEYIRKELVYTAVTRAKSTVKVFCEPTSFLEMCQKKTERFSGIAAKLKTL